MATQTAEAFGEYVAARWSMLHRLAALLVGPEGADDLAQTALVRAYLSWPEVQQSPSPDVTVQCILTRAAITGPAGRSAQGPPDASLWSQIAGLLPR